MSGTVVVINLVTDCGADPTGATASDAAAASAATMVAAATSASSLNVEVPSLLRTRVVIYAPPGDYVFTSDDPFKLAAAISGGSGGMWGWQVLGAGVHVTRFHYQPSGSGFSLFFNNDRWGYGRLSNFTADCSDTTAYFMRIVSNNNVYGWEYERLAVSGKWRRGFSYSGSNLGSEQRFDLVNFSSFVDAAIYVGSDCSDQTVNFWLTDCNLGGTDGDGLYFYYGGSINVRGGSWTALGTRSRKNWFFNFPFGDHSLGACRLTVEGVRIEYRAAGQMGLIACAWKQGTVAFNSVHDDITFFSGSGEPTGVETASFQVVNAPGPVVRFENCRLEGHHRYDRTGVNVWMNASPITYDGCILSEFADPADFIVSTAVTPAGGLPVVDFRCCCGKSATNTPGADAMVDQRLNWHLSTTASPRPFSRIFRSADANALLTSSRSATMKLPLNAYIRRMRLTRPPGGSNTATGVTYTVTAGGGSVVGAITVPGAFNAGFALSVETNFFITTAVQRTLTLTSSSGAENSVVGFVELEYFA